MKQVVYITAILLSSFCFSQDKSEKVVTVAYDACECIGKIDLKLDYKGKSEAIKKCIESANMTYQLTNKLSAISEKLDDTLPKITANKTIDTVKVEPSKINVSINASEDFKEIEDYLFETCGDMEELYFSNNKETSKKSVSNNEEALKYYSLGIDAGESQDYEKALEYYKKALKIDKKFTFAWDNLGITYRRLGKNKKAIEAYKKSLQLDAKGKMPLMNIGVAYEAEKEYDNAIKYYKKYKRIYKKDPEAPYGLGRMYFVKKEYEQAVDNMMKAYLLYAEIGSPYKKDAEKILSIMYNVLKEEGKLDIFKAAAKKNEININ